MRIRVAFALMGLIAFLAWSFWLRHERVPTSARTKPEEPTDRKSELAAHSPPVVTDSDLRASPLKGPPVEVKQRIAEVREGVSSINQPIEFHGIVIDQDERPLGGVQVVLVVMYAIEVLPGVQGSRSREVVRETDADGRFFLGGVTGNDVTVKSIVLRGYQLSARARRGFSYFGTQEIHKPDAKAPVVFRMWKAVGAERLITGEKFYGIVPDGRSYAIDLLEQQKTEGGDTGDIRVSIRRPGEVSSAATYDWSCTIEGVGGGVISTSDEFMYRAPEDGYEPRHEVLVSAGDPRWSDRAKRQIYIKSRGGKVFARLDVEIFANYRGEAVFSMVYFANPRGSPNLEYDPMQDIATGSRVHQATGGDRGIPANP